MSNQFNSDDEMLARLVREAGDPSVSLDPQYADTLRATILDRLSPTETPAPMAEAIRKTDVPAIIALQRTRQMKRIAKFAVAATILVVLGIAVFWITIGSSTSVAFARVAEALDSLKSATFDVTEETRGDEGQPRVIATGKGFFLAPSRQRVEILHNSAKKTRKMVVISDSQAAKCIMLMPEQRIAMTMDMAKMREEMKKTATHAPPDLFEMVRRLVREGSSGTGEKVEKLGKKEIDGRTAVGFRTRSEMGEMTLWADPQTARPIRIELTGQMFVDLRMVMSDFRYDVGLDQSLFSLESPAGYSTRAVDMTMPREEDLLGILRLIAEHNKGTFPGAIGMNKEFALAVESLLKPEKDKLEAKYGIKPKPGELPPTAMMAEAIKNLMPLLQKPMQGITFYLMLKPENDPHYVGGGVKLRAPDRPILWYKPTGADKYRVIYADLSVKDMTPDDVKKLPKAKTE